MHELNIIFVRMENFEIQNHELCVETSSLFTFAEGSALVRKASTV